MIVAKRMNGIQPGSINQQSGLGGNPNAGANSQNNDDKVLNLLKQLIARFDDKEKLVLYRTFESLKYPDSEFQWDPKDSDRIFDQNLKLFRDKFPTQIPLFRNIGFIAQRIGKCKDFCAMFDRPKLPPFLELNEKSHTRMYMLAKHMDTEDIVMSTQDNELEKDTFFVGFFFTLAAKQTENTLDVQDGNVFVNGEQREPFFYLPEAKSPVFFMTNSHMTHKTEVRFKISLKIPLKTLFIWFCVQNVKISPKYLGEINHDKLSTCIVTIPSQISRDFGVCPQCRTKYTFNKLSLKQNTNPLQAIGQPMMNMMQIPPQMQPIQQLPPQMQPIQQQMQQLPPQMQPIQQQMQQLPPQMQPIQQQMQQLPPQMQPIQQQMQQLPPQMQQQMSLQIQREHAQLQQQISPQMQRQSMNSKRQAQQTATLNMPQQFSSQMQTPQQNVYSSNMVISPHGSPPVGTPSMLMTPTGGAPQQHKVNMDLWEKLLHQKDRPKNDEPPSLFDEEKYNECWLEAGCDNALDDEDNYDDIVRNIY